MRFVLVNGRTPCPQTFCMLCCEPIGTSYLREIGTRLPYCETSAIDPFSDTPSLRAWGMSGAKHKARSTQQAA